MQDYHQAPDKQGKNPYSPNDGFTFLHALIAFVRFRLGF